MRDAYERSRGGAGTDLILTLGDNAYSDGTEREYERCFFDVYRDQLKRAILWPAFGNHDARSADSATESGVYYDLFTLPRLGQAGGVAFRRRGLLFVRYANVPTSSAWIPRGMTRRRAGDAPLAQTDPRREPATWMIAYWHHPPYS